MQACAAAPDLAARVDFLKAEEIGRACQAVVLTQPLAKSLTRRKKLLGDAVAASCWNSARAVSGSSLSTRAPMRSHARSRVTHSCCAAKSPVPSSGGN